MTCNDHTSALPFSFFVLKSVSIDSVELHKKKKIKWIILQSRNNNSIFILHCFMLIWELFPLIEGEISYSILFVGSRSKVGILNFLFVASSAVESLTLQHKNGVEHFWVEEQSETKVSEKRDLSSADDSSLKH